MKTRSQASKDERVLRSTNTRPSQGQVLTCYSEVMKQKRKKPNGENATHRHRRSLDDFPDEILCHILSFLPTKSAVRASVLCKRWRYIWTSLPSLDFEESPRCMDDEDITKSTKRKTFMDFVERVLCLNNTPRIQKFSIHCKVEYSASRINTWISTVVNRRPQELNFFLCSIYPGDNVLPHCVFSCETLEVLEIRAYELLLPSQICLPNLKKLTLGGVQFEDYHGLNLLFASSTLEELSIDFCVWKEGTVDSHLIISAPKLQSLTIYESYNDFSTSIVTISAPLRTFYYYGAFIKEFRFSCSSSVVMATIHYRYNGNFDHLNTVLRSLRFTKYLDISSFSVVQAHATVPIFENLTSLEISADSGNQINTWLDISCKELVMFLGKFPHLETLKIFQIIPEGIPEEGCDINHLLSPEFICLSSLKKISIGCIRGKSEEFLALHILLAKATSLETMELDLSRVHPSTRKKIKTFLSTIPRGSNSCNLNIIVDGKLCRDLRKRRR